MFSGENDEIDDMIERLSLTMNIKSAQLWSARSTKKLWCEESVIIELDPCWQRNALSTRLGLKKSRLTKNLNEKRRVPLEA